MSSLPKWKIALDDYFGSVHPIID